MPKFENVTPEELKSIENLVNCFIDHCTSDILTGFLNAVYLPNETIETINQEESRVILDEFFYGLPKIAKKLSLIIAKKLDEHRLSKS